MDKNGKLVLSILMDQEPAPPTPNVIGTFAMGLAGHNKYTENQPFLDHVVAKLEIPRHLMDRSDASLQFAYQRYKAYVQATARLSEYIRDGKWEGRRPSAAEVAEIFILKTMMFTNYKKGFGQVEDYPEMVKWLDQAEDAGSDLEVWGYEKGAYVFKDLFQFLENGGPFVEMDINSGKGKRKAEERKKGKGKAKDERGETKRARKSSHASKS